MKRIFPQRPASRLTFALLLALTLAGTLSAQAQIGSGWTRKTYTKKIHLDDENGLQIFNWTSSKSVGSGTPCADYRYDSATDTERFRIIDNRSNRSEIRMQDDYSTGSRQFQGYVKFSAPLNDESLAQIFGNSGSGATLTMMRGFSSSGGSIHVTGHSTIATGVYGKEVRINTIHTQNKSVQYYVNGALKDTVTDSDTAATNYHKYGCYGTLRTGTATVYWRQARFYAK